jgi:hypothetical protein
VAELGVPHQGSTVLNAGAGSLGAIIGALEKRPKDLPRLIDDRNPGGRCYTLSRELNEFAFPGLANIFEIIDALRSWHRLAESLEVGEVLARKLVGTRHDREYTSIEKSEVGSGAEQHMASVERHRKSAVANDFSRRDNLFEYRRVICLDRFIL